MDCYFNVSPSGQKINTGVADGTFRRATGGDSGTWSYDGKRLILKWKKWSPETLVQTVPGVRLQGIQVRADTLTDPVGTDRIGYTTSSRCP